MKINNKERCTNFEVMRIISMFMIVMWHIIIHGNLINHTAGVTKLILECLLSIFVVHVNSFILITGYYQYNKKISLKRFFSLFTLQWFYRIIIVITLLSVNIISLRASDLAMELLPIGSINYWYMNCYLALYLLSPFINKLIENMKQQDYRKLLIICFLLFSIIPYITNNITIENNGYSIIHFVYLYLLGAYLHKYPIKDNFHFKNYSREKRQLIFISGFILFAIINFLLIVLSKYFSTFPNKTLKTISDYIRLSTISYSPPVTILQSICYLLFFETLTIKNKFINYVSKSTLAVYLIHDNMFLRNNLYKLIGLDVDKIFGCKVLIYMIGLVILIFVIGIIIDKIRILLVKLLLKIKFITDLRDRFYNYLYRI